ncbi:hypothetical protein ABK734_20105 [Enterobacter sp. KE9933]|uniref:hypothetical protein n=1 Tax=Enterobacter sp. KE9933 TaxID=3118153 RepID=UPI0037505033
MALLIYGYNIGKFIYCRVSGLLVINVKINCRIRSRKTMGNFILLSMIFTPFFFIQAHARVIGENIYWTSGRANGQLAATCYYTLPDRKPMAVPTKLVVDKNTPANTWIYSWNYGDFLEDLVMSCFTSGISNDTAVTSSRGDVLVAQNLGKTEYIPTSNSGVGLYLIARVNSTCERDKGYNTIYVKAPNSMQCLSSNEIFITQGTQLLQTVTPVFTNGEYIFSTVTDKSFSLRAALITTAPLNPTGGVISVRNDVVLRAKGTSYEFELNPLTGNGFEILSPACQLKNKDYNVNMGRWAADAPVWLGNPLSGPMVPVNLSLECSGNVSHVRFRFEDAGTSPSGSKNISLYDTAGSNKVSGLEVEILYNGSKINVDNVTTTDTGGHGVTKPYPAAQPLYDSVSNAAFQARFVQNGNITRNGTSYVGPVTGKVNMYVTYD